MDNSTQFEIHLDRNGFHPEDVDVADLSDLISILENLLYDVADQKKFALEKLKTVISLNEIRSGSAVYSFQSNTASARGAFVETADIIKFQKFNTLTTTGRGLLNKLVTFSRKYQCDIAFYDPIGNAELAIVNQNTEITEPLGFYGETTIYGSIRMVGGKEPNVHIKTRLQPKIIIFKVSKSEAKGLARLLYDEVAVRGNATWDPVDYTITKFEMLEYFELSKKPIIEQLDELRESVGEYYSNIDNIVEHFDRIRREDE